LENSFDKSAIEKVSKVIWNWWWFIAILALGGGGAIEVIDPTKDCWDIIIHIVSTGLITAGGVIVTTGVGTSILKKTGYFDLFKNELIEIVCNHSFIKTMKPAKLIELKKSINEEIYTRELAYNEGSLLNTVSNSVEPFLNKYYFEKYSIEVFLKKHDNYLEKTVKREMHIKPAVESDTSHLKLCELFSTEFEPITEELALMELRDLRVSGENITKDYDIECMAMEEKGTNLYRINDFSKSPDERLKLKKNGLKVHLVVKYRTKLQDNLYVHKLPVACKDYQARINFENKKCVTQVGAFGFLDSEIEGKTLIDTQEDHIVVSFNDWVLPGDGVAFTWCYL